MKQKPVLLRFKTVIPLRCFFFTLFILLIILAQSCATNNCIDCTTLKEEFSGQPAYWNVELKAPVKDECTGKQALSIKTTIKPLFLPSTSIRINSCDDLNTLMDELGMNETDGLVSDLNGFVRICNTNCDGADYEISAGNILSIKCIGDPIFDCNDDFAFEAPCINCLRIRDGWLFFDKFEIYGFAGFRGANDTMYYNNPDGSYEKYPPEIFGVNRNATLLTAGFEMAGLWSIEQTDRFQMGFITGIWPVDESIFIPIGARLRYTAEQNPSPFSESCNTFFAYLDGGIPIDFNSDAVYFSDDLRSQRYFFDIGLGYDFVMNCNVDFSISLAFRQMNLPLPQINCCPEVPDNKRNPFRKSNMLMLTLGLTF